MQNENMFAEERKIKIVEFIQEHKKATVGDLCDKFSVSSATIRNDLRDLEHSGAIIRTHGGAIVKSKAGFELTSKQKKVRSSAEKKRVAERAVELIEDGDTIILDTGTTTLELARVMGRRRNVTVVTNDITIAAVLEEIENIHTIFMGGVVRKGFHCTVGAAGKAMLERLTVDKAFMGVNALSFEKGATTPDLQHADTKKMMTSIAEKVFILCDSSKLGRSAFAQFATLEEIDTIVIDAIEEKDTKRFEDDGIEVIIAD